MIQRYYVYKISFLIHISPPHCHFDWSGSGVEKSLWAVGDNYAVAIKFNLLLIL